MRSVLVACLSVASTLPAVAAEFESETTGRIVIRHDPQDPSDLAPMVVAALAEGGIPDANQSSSGDGSILVEASEWRHSAVCDSGQECEVVDRVTVRLTGTQAIFRIARTDPAGQTSDTSSQLRSIARFVRRSAQLFRTDAASSEPRAAAPSSQDTAVLPCLASMILPGAGQFMNREPGSGLLYLATAILAGAFLRNAIVDERDDSVLLYSIVLLVNGAASMADAYVTAKKIQEGAGGDLTLPEMRPIAGMTR